MAKQKIDFASMTDAEIQEVFFQARSVLENRRSEHDANLKADRRKALSPLFPLAADVAAAYMALVSHEPKVRLEVSLGDVKIVSCEVCVKAGTSQDDIYDIDEHWAKMPLENTIFTLEDAGRSTAFARRIMSSLDSDGDGIPNQWVKKLSPEIIKLMSDLAKARKKLDKAVAKSGLDIVAEEVVDEYIKANPKAIS